MKMNTIRIMMRVWEQIQCRKIHIIKIIQKVGIKGKWLADLMFSQKMEHMRELSGKEKGSLGTN